jgi:hypothetical protein
VELPPSEVLDDPQTLPRLPAEPLPWSFDGLRREALRGVQALAGRRWTDYNLHDPGVTLLEAVCYALTEQAYLAGGEVADLLADPHDRIAWARHGLHPPQQAFPCRPTTAEDLRRWLLDRVEGLQALLLQAGDPPGSGSDAPDAPEPPHGAWPGVLHAWITPAEGVDAQRLTQALRREAAAVRNLGEDLGAVCVVQRRDCRLLGRLSIGGARDPVELLAEIHERCADFIAAGVPLQSAGAAAGATAAGSAAASAAAAPPDERFDGPLLRGAVPAGPAAAAPGGELFVTDLVALVRTVEGVLDVDWLALQAGTDAPQTASLPWRDVAAGWALALQPPAAEGPAGLTLSRRGHALEVPLRELRRRIAERSAERQARRRAQLPAPPPLPQGRHQPAPPHLPLARHLPALYAVGEQALPAGAPLAHRAAARQLQGYLALFDQLLAHGMAQAASLRDLFAAGDPADPEAGLDAPVLRHHLLGDDELPGLGALQLGDPAALRRHLARQAQDPARRSRMLDVLLAMHGQSLPQNSLRQFCDHLAPAERERALLAAKLAFARDMEPLARDRAAGIDWTRAAWDQADNAAALQRRCALLLGLAHGHHRPLAAGLGGRLLVDADAFAAAEALAGQAAAQAGPRPARLQPLDLDGPQPRPLAAALQADPSARAAVLRALPLARRRRVPGALLRCATRHDRWAAVATDSGPALVVGPDEDGRWWQLAHDAAGDAGAPSGAGGTHGPGRADPATAGRELLRAALALRDWARALDAAGEGLHVVEHVLLRPLARAAHPGVGRGFHALRASVVFPGWTQRTRRRAFRRLAAETVQINTPAHVHARCLWLEPAAMAEFERLLRGWLVARQAWGEAGADPAAAAPVDAAAAPLALLLLRLQRGSAADPVDPAGPDDGDGDGDGDEPATDLDASAAPGDLPDPSSRAGRAGRSGRAGDSDDGGGPDGAAPGGQR